MLERERLIVMAKEVLVTWLSHDLVLFLNFDILKLISLSVSQVLYMKLYYNIAKNEVLAGKSKALRKI